MTATDRNDNGQAAHWNGRAGRAWADAQPMLDRMFEPFAQRLVEAARTGRRVLDVGCGAGATTLAVAQRLGARGRCVGVDVSRPLIAAARARAERGGVPASFVHADAQTHAFVPASFDTIISRFGVMFFENAVDAFANLLRAATSDASLAFVAWRTAAENPFMTTAERAAAPLVPNLPARQPDAPGQFFFGDARRIETVLAQSGWCGIDVRPIDVECTLPERELIGHFSRLGPLGQLFGDLDDATRARVVDTVRAAFAPYVHGAEVRFTAACWLVGARAPAKWSKRQEAAGV
ncbi:class I SAM-dependent methyltransferase [Burkholderia pseudomallei]|uniref:class I SAM-dependent methyltransferase n=1 Tax=Burkholderia pseudomallei TaxID=28450 RepID=UPI00034763DF|nr:class I SAM-dependent methyltransferase [Burkholderia pseudomallei]KGX77294.1 methyltransferase domain protein [Burkholderia pseudomallei MSHR435]AIP51459.1 methyltransferase domain protein [Burkholderia pseudomallei HBPUB10134a]AIV50378.1 methyltransferase small domain protein [Burkholderia pseudomallei MSHR1153]AIV59671.1 methyltransferase small domain protein [Burkholderia pseudomallei MSHR2243]AIV72152.1 methyltransferase domain protein [Burkholderia pseudomallei MSHR62]